MQILIQINALVYKKQLHGKETTKIIASSRERLFLLFAKNKINAQTDQRLCYSLLEKALILHPSTLASPCCWTGRLGHFAIAHHKNRYDIMSMFIVLTQSN